MTGGRLNIGNALACGNQAKVVLSAPANGFVVGRDRRHPDQGPGRQLRRSGRDRQRHGHRQRDAGGAVGGEPGHRSVHGELHRQRAGRADGDGDRDDRELHGQPDGERQRVPELHLPGRALLVGRRDGCRAARRRRRRRCVLDAQHRVPDLVLRADVLDRVHLLERLSHPRVERGSDRASQCGDTHDRDAQRRDRAVLGRPVPRSDRLGACRGQRRGAEPHALRRVVQRPALQRSRAAARSRSRRSSRRTATFGTSTWTRASNRPGIRPGTRAARRRRASSARTASSAGRSRSTSRCSRTGGP